MSTHSDAVVIGAGQAGLGTAKVLADRGLSVVVLERGRIGETWLSQRWDSFALNTPNWMNTLPGLQDPGHDSEGFMSHVELVHYFESYASTFDIDVRVGHNVTKVGHDGRQAGFAVEANSDAGSEQFESPYVVIASGIAHQPKIPSIASKLPDDIAQLSTGTYRSPAQLPDGSVLVVGGGQSGGQIVEDLLGADREVYFSTSKVGRVPRRYRGADFMYWMLELGIWDLPTNQVDAEMILATNPLTSGVGPRGHTISFQQLAFDGAQLMGRLLDVENAIVKADDLGIEYLTFSDEFSADLKHKIDEHIAEEGIDAPDAETDSADNDRSHFPEIQFVTELDLEAADVRTVIWCTGFSADFSWIDLPVTDAVGMPIHKEGVSEVPGLYFIGFPWLASRKSGVIFGIEEDAERIAADIGGKSERGHSD